MNGLIHGTIGYQQIITPTFSELKRNLRVYVYSGTGIQALIQKLHVQKKYILFKSTIAYAKSQDALWKAAL